MNGWSHKQVNQVNNNGIKFFTIGEQHQLPESQVQMQHKGRTKQQ
jgi:hypothetical protein